MEKAVAGYGLRPENPLGTRLKAVLLRILLGILIVGPLAFPSCVPRKKLIYFQTTHTQDSTFTPLRTDYPLQPGDVLSIKFTGPDPVALAPFGQENIPTGTAQVSNIQLFVQGYSINDSGLVRLPVIGQVKVAGMTLQQADKLMQDEIRQYVHNAVAQVRLVSFKITVLGEVRVPGTLYVYNQRLSLPEALGYVGDLTDLGNREHIRLIRNRQGKVTVTTLNLTDRRLLGSPYFYLQPNDVIYVEPIANKADRLNLPTLTVLFSALSTVLVLVSILVR